MTVKACRGGGILVRHNRRLSRRLRPWAAAALTLLLASAAALSPVAGISEAKTPRRPPNVLLIMSDDQTYGTLGVMPAVQALQERGTTYTQYFDSFPLCCPTRAAVLSGQYTHNNGVWDNTGIGGGYAALLRKGNTLPRWLHDAGYRTGILGKLMNGYSMTRYGVPKGWDLFRVPEGNLYSYDDTWIRDETGRLSHHGGYRTDVYTRLGIGLLNQLGTDQPWFAWLAPNAPHTGAPVDSDDIPGLNSCSPSPAWRDHDQLEPLPPTAAFNEADVTDKPRHISQLPLLTPEQESAIHEAYTQQLECLRSLDTYVATVVNYLAATGQLANTDIIYVSDNGYAYGEHRVPSGKKLPYDYAAHLPLVAAGPDFPQGIDTRPRSSVDMTATILDITGATPGHVVDGTSIRTAVDPLRPILHEGRVIGSNSMRSKIWKYTGIRTPSWLYARYRYKDWTVGHELYSRIFDPDQISSVVADPRFHEVKRDLSRQLQSYEHCAGAECP
jgi:N-acetylglucosamine-6-sulfatase